MDSIEIKRPVAIKAIMTESFRAQILKETEETWKTHEASFRQMESLYEQSKKSGALRNPEIEKQIQIERVRLSEIKKEMEKKVKEFESVADGEEVLFRVIEGPVNVKQGDDIRQILSGAEIVVKDWIVTAVRGL